MTIENKNNPGDIDPFEIISIQAEIYGEDGAEISEADKEMIEKFTNTIPQETKHYLNDIDDKCKLRLAKLYFSEHLENLFNTYLTGKIPGLHELGELFQKLDIFFKKEDPRFKNPAK